LRTFRRRGVDRGQRHDVRVRRNARPLHIQRDVECVDRQRSVVTRRAVRMYGEFLYCSRGIFGSDRELVAILDMLVVTEVLCGAARFVHAVRAHRRPAELECENCGNDVHEATDHGRNIAWTGNGLPSSSHAIGTYRSMSHREFLLTRAVANIALQPPQPVEYHEQTSTNLGKSLHLQRRNPEQREDEESYFDPTR
jgi:hypothetical protein